MFLNGLLFGAGFILGISGLATIALGTMALWDWFAGRGQKSLGGRAQHERGFNRDGKSGRARLTEP
jgi:hypothetical protein